MNKAEFRYEFEDGTKLEFFNQSVKSRKNTPVMRVRVGKGNSLVMLLPLYDFKYSKNVIPEIIDTLIDMLPDDIKEDKELEVEEKLSSKENPEEELTLKDIEKDMETVDG